jgi:hypothetical protein
VGARSTAETSTIDLCVPRSSSTGRELRFDAWRPGSASIRDRDPFVPLPRVLPRAAADPAVLSHRHRSCYRSHPASPRSGGPTTPGPPTSTPTGRSGGACRARTAASPARAVVPLRFPVAPCRLVPRVPAPAPPVPVRGASGPFRPLGPSLPFEPSATKEAERGRGGRKADRRAKGSEAEPTKGGADRGGGELGERGIGADEPDYVKDTPSTSDGQHVIGTIKMKYRTLGHARSVPGPKDRKARARRPHRGTNTSERSLSAIAMSWQTWLTAQPAQ